MTHSHVSPGQDCIHRTIPWRAPTWKTSVPSSGGTEHFRPAASVADAEVKIPRVV